MLVIKHPGAAVVTTTEAKRDLPGAFKVAEQMRVYVTKDGQPIGGLVSLEMMSLLEQALAEREERRAKRANWPVRVLKLGEESPNDSAGLSPEARIEMMGRLAHNAYAFRDGSSR